MKSTDDSSSNTSRRLQTELTALILHLAFDTSFKLCLYSDYFPRGSGIGEAARLPCSARAQRPCRAAGPDTPCLHLADMHQDPGARADAGRSWWRVPPPSPRSSNCLASLWMRVGSPLLPLEAGPQEWGAAARSLPLSLVFSPPSSAVLFLLGPEHTPCIKGSLSECGMGNHLCRAPRIALARGDFSFLNGVGCRRNAGDELFSSRVVAAGTAVPPVFWPDSVYALT